MSHQPELLLPQNPKENDKHGENLIFDPSFMSYQSEIPSQFIWPDHEKPSLTLPLLELQVPQIDLKAFLSGDPQIVSTICSKVNETCKKHGFFHLVNHGVDTELIAKAHNIMDDFFCMQLSEKQRAQRKIGDECGYANSFVGRFSSKLPWKETLSFHHSAEQSRETVEEYFVGVMGEDFRQFG